MRHQRITAAVGSAVIIALSVGVSAAPLEVAPEDDPWLQGQQRGYLSALCALEADGVITPQQSAAYLRRYSEIEYGFNTDYLQAVLMNYIGLRRCSFSRRVHAGEPLLP